MAIEKQFGQRITMLVGESGGLEYGFQEFTSSPGTVGSMTNRTTHPDLMPIPQVVVEMNSVASDGTVWAKFRDARIDDGISPGIDIDEVSEVSFTVYDERECTNAQGTVVMTKTAGIGYSGVSVPVRDILIANSGSTVTGKIVYTLV